MFNRKKKGKKDYPEMVDNIRSDAPVVQDDAGYPKGYDRDSDMSMYYPTDDEERYQQEIERYDREVAAASEKRENRRAERENEYSQNVNPGDTQDLSFGRGRAGDVADAEAGMMPEADEWDQDAAYESGNAEDSRQGQHMDDGGNEAGTGPVKTGKGKRKAAKKQTVKKEAAGKTVRGSGADIPVEEIAEDGQMDARDLARLERRKRRKRELRRIRITITLLILIVLGLAAFAGYQVMNGQGMEISNPFAKMDVSSLIQRFTGGSDSEETKKAMTEATSETEPDSAALETIRQSEALESERIAQSEAAAAAETLNIVIEEADLKAMQYDYDAAIALLKGQEDYETNTTLQEKVAGYEATRDSCVEVSPDTVSHVFVHSLIVDTARAFDGDAAQDGYNLNMVTVDEFKKVIQSMYDNGYVLVSLHDMGEIDENGNMQRKSILLPEGKKPVVFSQDDVSYYHSYEGDGFADRLIIDENGEVKNEYTDAEGNTMVGDYDMVPVLDTFIKEHPDFSYHGRKGIVVLTGYNGVFGYRTDGDYVEQTSLQDDQRKWLDAHPEYDFDVDVAAATEIANAMKENGWEFASHTWGHIPVADVTLEKLQTDTEKWLKYVKPIVGETDMIIFAFGSDIGDWTGYSADNEKFNYLKSVGFDYFCNVDGSSLSWVQFGNTYLRQGRMNIDGYRMATNPDVLAPLFNVSEVYDSSRPSMVSWSQ